MKIMHVVGARPNFMKIAPVIRAMARYSDDFEQMLVHTGQHYDAKMSAIFFEELGLPTPDINLSVGSGSHANQTAQVMMRFEPVVLGYKPDWVFVPGDVNSTVACALVCSKIGIRVAHVEAGLRSGDRTMPEEINRIVTDQLSDLLFTPSRDADKNLVNEGIPAEKIRFVGNVMIDTLIRLLPKAEARWDNLRGQLGLSRYVLATLHRPSNVDDDVELHRILQALASVSCDIPVVFPVHPRTRQRLEYLHDSTTTNIQFIEPLGYLDFLAVQTHAQIVLTDSGGVQEETTYLGIPCLTLRPNTERPTTVSEGTNRLVTSTNLTYEARRLLKQERCIARPTIDLWDGEASDRIVSVMRALPNGITKVKSSNEDPARLEETRRACVGNLG